MNPIIRNQIISNLSSLENNTSSQTHQFAPIEETLVTTQQNDETTTNDKPNNSKASSSWTIQASRIAPSNSSRIKIPKKRLRKIKQTRRRPFPSSRTSHTTQQNGKFFSLFSTDEDEPETDPEVRQQWLIIVMLKCILLDPLSQCLDACMEFLSPLTDCLPALPRRRGYQSIWDYLVFQCQKSFSPLQWIFGWNVPLVLLYISMLVFCICFVPSGTLLVVGIALLLISLEHVADLGMKTGITGGVLMALGFIVILLGAFTWFASITLWKLYGESTDHREMDMERLSNQPDGDELGELLVEEQILTEEEDSDAASSLESLENEEDELQP